MIIRISLTTHIKIVWLDEKIFQSASVKLILSNLNEI